MPDFVSDFDLLAARGELPPIVSLAPQYEDLVDPDLNPGRFPLPTPQGTALSTTAPRLAELVPLAQGQTAEERAGIIRASGLHALKGTIDNRRNNLIADLLARNGPHAVARGYRLGIIVCDYLTKEEWPVEPLTDIQLGELRAAAGGLTAQETADRRGVSYASTKDTRVAILSRLGAANMPQAITIARARGILPVRSRRRQAP